LFCTTSNAWVNTPNALAAFNIAEVMLGIRRYP
jgi:hypothetical protein